jgi:glycosyltransferase involved in cell wall biosynthesis
LNRKIILTVNSAWNLVTFRAGLIRALVASGYDVVALAPSDRHVPRVRELGARFIDLPMENAGTHPVHDLHLLFRYWRVLRSERPAVVLGFTIKPNIYGSLAAASLGIPVINNIAGLGTAFLRSGWLNRTARMLYRVALSRSTVVFFQNGDDLNLFISSGLVRRERARRIPGSGVDTSYFAPTPRAPRNGRPFRFLLLGRLLWDKGVGEYVDAARRLRATGANAEALILGFVDAKNPSAISMSQIEAWAGEGVIRYLGDTDDVRPFLSSADCVVLPSYREGVPRALLEAASMARPIITTDAPGCRDVVRNNVSGYAVPIKDVESLYSAMRSALELPETVLTEMGMQSRALVVDQFQEKMVVAEYLTALAQLLSARPQS